MLHYRSFAANANHVDFTNHDQNGEELPRDGVNDAEICNSNTELYWYASRTHLLP
jgi:hypothetical protein